MSIPQTGEKSLEQTGGSLSFLHPFFKMNRNSFFRKVNNKIIALFMTLCQQRSQAVIHEMRGIWEGRGILSEILKITHYFIKVSINALCLSEARAKRFVEKDI